MSVGSLSLPDRLEIVVRKAAAQLPADVGRRLLALLSTKALGTMAVVVTIWAGAHFFGAGELADAILLIAGYILVGPINVGGLIYQVYYGLEE